VRKHPFWRVELTSRDLDWLDDCLIDLDYNHDEAFGVFLDDSGQMVVVTLRKPGVEFASPEGRLGRRCVHVVVPGEFKKGYYNKSSSCTYSFAVILERLDHAVRTPANPPLK
jgi:hypothetical protein